MLTLWRRHIADCPHSGKGRTVTKCSCPIWIDGILNGKRLRKSLETRDWQRAIRKAALLEDPEAYQNRCVHPGCETPVDAGRCARHTRTITEAVSSFHASTLDLANGTVRNYKRTLRVLEEFLSGRGVVTVDQVELEALNAFRATRPISARTWLKELEIMRHFFRHCLDNEWCPSNPAAKVQAPKNLKPAKREPYEVNEITRIIAACDLIGRGPYERLRARAMILLLRYTALRISDVSTLERDRVRDGEIFVRTTKNGKIVKLPVHPDLQAALGLLPVPRGGGDGCPYFFWSGNGSTRAMVRDATRTVSAVFRKAGVAGACSHRFRHTIATEILELGGTFEEAADILGDSVEIVRRHYAKWSRGRQARITDLLARIWHTKKTGLQDDEIKALDLVDGVGIEPTTSALRTPRSPN